MKVVSLVALLLGVGLVMKSVVSFYDPYSFPIGFCLIGGVVWNYADEEEHND